VAGATGSAADRGKIGDRLAYVSLDRGRRHGVRFSAALRDFRSMPPDEFRMSGLLDDLILGLMAKGGDDDGYIAEVISRIRAMEGEPKTTAIEKFIAVCATMKHRKAGQIDLGDTNMWVADPKENYVVRQILELAGKERFEAAAAEGRAKGMLEGLTEGRVEGKIEGKIEGILIGLARSIARYAVNHGIELPADPSDVETALAHDADEATLDRMLDDIENMTDFHSFIKRHGVRGGKFDG